MNSAVTAAGRQTGISAVIVIEDVAVITNLRRLYDTVPATRLATGAVARLGTADGDAERGEGVCR